MSHTPPPERCVSDTLIVIPVRGGSVGIPDKAIRLLGARTALERTIETARQIDADVVVTTDSDVIYQQAAQNGAAVVREPPALNPQGQGALDAAVSFATSYMERRQYPKTYATVVTMQCTSPFTARKTVEKAIQVSKEMDTTVLTVRDDRGLRWESANPEQPILTSRAPRRVTRQRMQPCWRETGAVFVTPRRWVEPTSRFSYTAYLLEVKGREAVDLDTMEDWWIAERYAMQDTNEVHTAA
jgi:CMP-N-acetylneuraminic acid synthetase